MIGLVLLAAGGVAAVVVLWRVLANPVVPVVDAEAWILNYPSELHNVLRDVAGVDSWMFWQLVGLGDRLAYPRVREAVVSPAGCVLTVGMLGGQSVSVWETALDTITQTLAVPQVVIKKAEAGAVVLEVRISDPLVEVLPLPDPDPSPDLRAVWVGMSETGPWTVNLLLPHWLGAGATGAGKGSVLWSMICGIAPHIHSGLVRLWGIDPKGGMELGKGAGLFTRLVDDSGREAVDLLKDAVALMKKRAKLLRARGLRDHVPTIEEPFVLVVIDELADLVAYETDRNLRDEAMRYIRKLLSQGRAPGVGVVSFVQDPSKETVPFRQLYPGRIGLRLDEPTQVNMVLGQGAKLRGAECDSIPASLPGVGYVAVEGDSRIERVRAFYPDDAAIEDIAVRFAAPADAAGGPVLAVVS